MRWLKGKYAGMSIRDKFIVCSVIIISFLVLALIFSTRFLVTRTVTQTTTENYMQKFDIVSNNLLRLFASTEQLSNIIITDSEVQLLLKNMNSFNAVDKMNQKIMVENYLDFLDSTKSYNQFSNIAIIMNNLDVVTTNKIRTRIQEELAVYRMIQEEKPRKTWYDFYDPQASRLGDKRITFAKSVIDYTSGLSIGNVAIDIDGDILTDHFSELNYGERGSYLVSDLNGNVKIRSDGQLTGVFKENIGTESFFAWAVDHPGKGKVFRFETGRYLITTTTLDKLGWVMFGIIPLKELTEVGDQIIATIYVIGFLALIIAVALTQYLTANITKPIKVLSVSMKRFGSGDFNIRVPTQSNDEIGLLSTVFNRMIAQITELIEQVKSEQRNKSHFEFAALQAQINPHFLYNTLSSACSLIAMNRNDEALTMINSISSFYRTVLSSGEEIISIKDEIENISSYIQIQKIRYGDKIKYELDFPPDLFDKKIVKFSLQPIVENAIYHGIKNTEDGTGRIAVRGRSEGNEIVLQVEDNGIGMPQETIHRLTNGTGDREGKSSFGIRSIDKRIKLYFGHSYGVAISSVDGRGTSVTIRLPSIYGKGAYSYVESSGRG
ncbi:sensor histidine kinase [Cohnella cellulosilytica]|uniref:histidine kinase n=1 Tax=Cohnella cellulosilytica TaxID=986710 RepID=A0ABW2FCM5_9BACL